jgi:hypothetical protein
MTDRSTEHATMAGVSHTHPYDDGHASRRLAEYACDYAADRDLDGFTVAHKSNVMRETDGRFLDAVTGVADDHGLVAEPVLMDALATHLVLQPAEFEVVVSPNLAGDVLSDLAAGLVGGLGLLPSANVGPERGLFEPVHGTAPDLAGEGVANPSAAVLSAAMLLDYLDRDRAAERVRGGVEATLVDGPRTPDLGGGDDRGGRGRDSCSAIARLLGVGASRRHGDVSRGSHVLDSRRVVPHSGRVRAVTLVRSHDGFVTLSLINLHPNGGSCQVRYATVWASLYPNGFEDSLGRDFCFDSPNTVYMALQRLRALREFGVRSLVTHAIMVVTAVGAVASALLLDGQLRLVSFVAFLNFTAGMWVSHGIHSLGNAFTDDDYDGVLNALRATRRAD